MSHSNSRSMNSTGPPPAIGRQGSLGTASAATMKVEQGASDNNNVLATAMEVCTGLSDVGRALPFVAPVFILLKIIIDIEQRAQEVDAKCNDLIERITFMLSHLPVLKKMVDEEKDGSGRPSFSLQAIKQVVERMNEAVKNAAALIAAYRKQSPIARRLSISNREKFTTCADALNTCCSDLLMSLQIRQSQQLDMLTTRAVPVDDDDWAAKTFVEAHGGDFEAVQYDRELVKEFAEERNMTMDDSVMGQLEDGAVNEAVDLVSVRLEKIVKDNVSTAIVDGLKELAAQLTTVEHEQSLVCVQCESSFTQSSNHDKACSFHKAEYDSWSKSYPCCGTPHPCQYSFHREKHHCDYPYGTFFPRARNINNYVDTQEEWAAISDTSLDEDEKVEKASVGKLLRWVSRGERLQEPTILISVGRIWWKEKYYFNTFTLPDLQNISKSVRHSRRTLIYRTDPSETAESYASAEWLLSVSGKITGVRLTAKTVTSSVPFVRVCPIDLATGEKSGEVLAISDGGMRSYVPASPYVLPATVHIGPELSDEPVRPVRKDFKTRTSSPAFRVILKGVADPPLAANPKIASQRVDYFGGSISVFNNNAPGSNFPVTIADAKAQYRFVGDKDYKDAVNSKGESLIEILDYARFPMTIDPRQSSIIQFEVGVPRTEEDVKKDIRWWNRAVCARHRPVRIKLILEDIEGEEASLVLEYVFRPFPFTRIKEEDLAAFWFDEPDMISRRMVRVEKAWSEENVLRIDGSDLSVKQLEKLVYQALKTGKTELDMEIGKENGNGEWEWKAWALIDISCRRVYAFKILLQEGKLVPDDKKRFGCLGYVLCPEYGQVAQGKSRSICYATELVKFPPPGGLQPYVDPQYPTDDKVDDLKPPVPPKPTRTLSMNGANNDQMAGSSSGQTQLPAELNHRLASIDSNLARIADALEKLVGVLGR
ncbi:hypothetical protein DFP72DRAFT_954574 [Ephemerocybe angulata]|uniref:Uncharacterized protein n=1 Tax=Ephemerocybe angulata TaxID=980116 RepID=A0A8H6MDU4_9AGAR|nr:hypothetical protein DFP72DRAFT_954574 [Tulosesus angulatus]